MQSDMDLWLWIPGACGTSHGGAEPGGFKSIEGHTSALFVFTLFLPCLHFAGLHQDKGR